MDINGVGMGSGATAIQKTKIAGTAGNSPFKSAIESLEKMKKTYDKEISKIKNDKTLDKKTADLRIEGLEQQKMEIEAEISRLKMEETKQSQEEIKSNKKNEQISNSDTIDKTAQEQAAVFVNKKV